MPGSPRAVLRTACDAVASPTEARIVALAARIARCPRDIVEGWEAVEAAVVAGGPVPTPADAGEQVVLWHRAVAWTRRWLYPDPPERPEDPRRVETQLRKAVGNAERCGVCAAVFTEADAVQVQLFPALCNTRCCLACMRRRLRAVVARWAPLYAAPVRPGYQLSFLTVGSVGGVETRSGVRLYLRQLGRLAVYMRRGHRRYGIPPGSWVGGLRALEVVPRPVGGFNHAHLAVVRAAFYPYGIHAAALPTAPSPEQLGFRALLRSLGLGEVFDDARVTTASDGSAAIADYVSKVGKYMAKVEGESSATEDSGRTWEGRLDLQRAMRGIRILQPFGACQGLLGGPDRNIRKRARVPLGALNRIGLYDPEDPDTWDKVPPDVRGLYLDECDPELRGDADEVTTRTYYREDTLQSWDPWCDVARLRASLLTATA